MEVHFPSPGDLSMAAELSRMGADRLGASRRSHPASHDGGATWTAFVRPERDGEVDVVRCSRARGSYCCSKFARHLLSHDSRTFAAVPSPGAPATDPSGHRPMRDACRGEPVRLFAVAAGAPLRQANSWYSDLSGEIGEGAHLTVTLRPGRQRVKVRSRTPFQVPGLCSSSRSSDQPEWRGEPICIASPRQRAARRVCCCCQIDWCAFGRDLG